MLTKKQKDGLSCLLLAIGENEQMLENLRSTLCSMKEFEPVLAFRQLDSEFSGTIDEINVKQFLDSHEYKFSVEDIKLYLKWHCSYDRMALSYPEFIKTLIPYDNKFQRELALSRPTLLQSQELPRQISEMLSRVISQDIQNLKSLEYQKQCFLQLLQNTPLLDAFNEIDTLQLGSFDYLHLHRFFQRMGYSLSDSQLICILRSLDKSEQGKIIFTDFQLSLMPKFPSKDLKSSKIAILNGNHNVNEQAKLLSDLYQDNQEYYLIESAKEFKSRRTNQYKPKLQFNLHQLKLPFKQITTLYSSQPTMDPSSLKQAITQFVSSLTTPLHSPPSDYAQFLLHNFIELKTLMSTLYQFIKLDKQTEEQQLALTICKDFNVLDVFREIDTKDKGFVTAGQFCQILKNKWKIAINQTDAFIIIRRFQDQNQNGKLFFKHFVKIIVPNSKHEAKFFNSRLPYCQAQSAPIHQIYSKQTIATFSSFIKTLVANECVIEGLKQRLQQRQHFQLYTLFQLIDQNSDELITESDLLKMFENFAIDVKQSDIKYLFWRFNSEDNLLISFSNFFQQMTPTSPKLYSSQKN